MPHFAFLANGRALFLTLAADGKSFTFVGGDDIVRTFYRVPTRGLAGTGAGGGGGGVDAGVTDAARSGAATIRR